jgi:hypothetical protein
MWQFSQPPVPAEGFRTAAPTLGASAAIVRPVKRGQGIAESILLSPFYHPIADINER